MSEKIVLPTHPQFKDLTGQRFGRLLVLSYAGVHPKNGLAIYCCRCDCGAEITAAGCRMRYGHVQSCGCKQRDRSREYHTKHGMASLPEYQTWKRIRARCLNPKSRVFRHYGGRGITICQRWLDSFEAFYADMGPRPTPTHSIDRIDNNGNYEPGNCRWATQTTQVRNSRKARNVEFCGQTKCVSEWAVLYGLEVSAVFWRLKAGWSVDRALTTPSKKTLAKRGV